MHPEKLRQVAALQNKPVRAGGTEEPSLTVGLLPRYALPGLQHSSTIARTAGP